MTPTRVHPSRLTALALPLFALAGAGAYMHTPSDSDAIRQIERHWLEAEFRGDTAYLRQLLLPNYRTVGPNGTRDRAAILARALQHAAAHDSVPSGGQSGPEVQVVGATAIATFTRPDTSSSADVFVLDHGAWHAFYSQHTPLTPRTAASR
jgi:hypothetical protein